MDMLSYIMIIQHILITQYGFQESQSRPGLPVNVPDGDYPMTIDGKVDNVRIVDGKIHCCRFES